MKTFYVTPDTLPAEQDQFALDIKEYASGSINPVKFKAIRVAHGVYEQRQNHTYMIRIRCAAGGITPKQLRKVAELGEKYGSGEVHFTTRQEVQLHNVLIQDVMKIIKGLHDVGLSSRGGGGNTIRNILTSPDSGINPDEVFDVDPYATALTTRMICEPDSWNLPRKFKIAMSNSPKDTAYTQATCLGFVAKMNGKKKGFQVFCAGGMGAKPMVGNMLFDWVPENHVYQITKAMKIMFDKHGNRRSKFSNRIKFLWRKLDRDEFVRLFEEEYNKIKDDRSLDLVLDPMENAAKETNLTVISKSGPDFDLWKTRYLTKQKQPGLFSIKIPLQLGDLITEDAYSLCSLLDHFGDNTIRCDRAQNIQLRNIPEKYLGNAFQTTRGLKKSLVAYAPFLGNMINCTGAQTCKLGICLPRGLSKAIRDRLVQSDLKLDELNDFRINMSGCPNTCGMHHVADLGFFGKIGRSEKKKDIYPAYNVLSGAQIGAGVTKYAERQGEVSAKHIPNFIHDFLKVYLGKKKSYASYHDFLAAEGNALIATLCEQYKHVPEYDEDASYYTDFGAKKRLSLDELGTAECSAGMFDMIDVDKKFIGAQLAQLDKTPDDKQALYRIVFHASRMLLVTRGLDAKDDEQVFDLFGKHFVTTELVSKDYLGTVNAAKSGELDQLKKERAIALANEVLELYKNMDDSLRFKTKTGVPDMVAQPAVVEKIAKDYRGVACPMNFVKTKLVLDTMQAGQQLEILLDDGEPIQNVPNSVKLEGHKVLEQKKVDNHWSVLIQKS